MACDYLNQRWPRFLTHIYWSFVCLSDDLFQMHVCVGRMTKYPWWRHQMETFSAFLAICAGNSPIHGEFPAQRPVTQSFDIYFDLRLNKRLSEQSWGWWFETLLRPLWRHSNVNLWSMCSVLFSVPHNVNLTYDNNASEYISCHAIDSDNLGVIMQCRWGTLY